MRDSSHLTTSPRHELFMWLMQMGRLVGEEKADSLWGYSSGKQMADSLWEALVAKATRRGRSKIILTQFIIIITAGLYIQHAAHQVFEFN